MSSYTVATDYGLVTVKADKWERSADHELAFVVGGKTVAIFTQWKYFTDETANA